MPSEPASATATPVEEARAALLARAGLDAGRLPRHVAVIMDGNGRWAAERGLPRAMGHPAGARVVREVFEAACELGVEAMTLYSFSSENWKRPDDEIAALMGLYVDYLRSEREELVARNIRFRQIGRRGGLPEDALKELDKVVEATAGCSGPTLCLAVNYGSRGEIMEAVRAIAERVARGEVDPASIDEGMISAHLQTAGLPDPDLLIRTAGEMRISNYLLWQISYAELYVTKTLWPDFGRAGLIEALRAYQSRSRRFGGLDDPAATP